jgi:nonribosomal peptide synthetase DhbF
MKILDGGPLPLGPDAPRTLIDVLLRAASRDADRGIVYVDTDGQKSTQSYGALLREARQVATGLAEGGARPGAKVILHVQPLRDYFTAL